VNFRGECRLKIAVEDDLNQRILHTLRAIKSTTDSINAQRSALLYTKLKENVAAVGVSAGIVAVSGNPALVAPEALRLAGELMVVLNEWGDCTANQDLRSSCENLRNFQRILHESATDLVKVQGSR
jgi:hypothetical protein